MYTHTLLYFLPLFLLFLYLLCIVHVTARLKLEQEDQTPWY
jgi:hypothetical protein